MHIIVWKYKVKEENRVEFEFEYGKLGTWSKLFNTSENYKGSTLHRNSDIYLLVDTWLDKQSYESFINLNSKLHFPIIGDCLTYILIYCLIFLSY